MRKSEFNDIVLQDILHHTDLGIHVINKDRKTMIYNEAMAKLEGLKSNLVLNKNILDIFPSLDEESSTLINVMRTGKAILSRTQTYLNYKGQKITTINSTLPLIYKVEASFPGSPEACIAVRPVTFPTNAFDILAVGVCFNNV